MFATIATIYAVLSLLVSVVLLAALMLSSRISQQEEPIEAPIIVEEPQPSSPVPYFLES
jgi:hypothetical protein